MSGTVLKAGFIPLVDAAPLIVAKELGFAQEEGLDLELTSAPSWSTLRDMLAFGQIDAAHMLSPVPVASAIGLLRGLPRLNALSVLSTNGTVIGVSQTLAADMAKHGYPFDFNDAARAGAALARQPRPIRIGVPFLLSMHASLISVWLKATGLIEETDFQILAVPPSLMANAMKNGDLDAFCVGEPWGSLAAEKAGSVLILPGTAIWSCAPEKVLAVREDWANTNPAVTGKLMRAVWRAGEWLAQPGNVTMAAEIMATKGELGESADMIDRALFGRMRIDEQGSIRNAPDFMRFSGYDNGFPWQSQAAWIARNLAQRFGLDVATAIKAAHMSFRSDLYRQNLAGLNVDLPLDSAKIEGAFAEDTAVAAVHGQMILAKNHFFDGQIFDPGKIFA
ncbi:ABC transporter substrate-binding protein [Cognatishimia sp. SS12]|uniref:ABC transporter substrate-binding protein n=1 Tax=Cognatishimia sp. SS12 TaxID=2979465 RepID=UPI00232BD27A|nr:ABC transporter substrate-binding protein [Cognatishimia sp. SS12]MDC0738799.1 ABC transporter substrate-binding protein [Cognatishimia sp. SS12]